MQDAQYIRDVRKVLNRADRVIIQPDIVLIWGISIIFSGTVWISIFKIIKWLVS